MKAYWYEQCAVDLPAGDDWLSAGELARLGAMRFAKRRADWRLGRWTAKRAVAARLGLSTLADIEIFPAESGAPEVYVDGHAVALTISISHRAGVAICAVAGPGVALGCDLELAEPRCETFASDYFTEAEQALVEHSGPSGRAAMVALVWSAKESVLKALRVGLRVDTRCVAVEFTGLGGAEDAWQAMHARYDGQGFSGWWRRQGDWVRTLVANPQHAVTIPPVCPAGIWQSRCGPSSRPMPTA